MLSDFFSGLKDFYPYPKEQQLRDWEQVAGQILAPSVFIQGGGSLITPAGAVVPNPARSKIMDSGDTFFTVNYGGGVKFLKVVGPMGFRVDVRGRTIPNFLSQTTTWLEPTAGVTFNWGER